MVEFAVKIEGEEHGRWVLAVDAASNQVLIDGEGGALRWLPMSMCRLIRVMHPDMPRPVVLVQPQASPKIVMPSLQLSGNGTRCR